MVEELDLAWARALSRDRRWSSLEPGGVENLKIAKHSLAGQQWTVILLATLGP